MHPDGAYARGGCANPAAAALPERLQPLIRKVKAGNGLVIASQFTLWPNALGEPMISPHLLALRPFLLMRLCPGIVGSGLCRYFEAVVEPGGTKSGLLCVLSNPVGVGLAQSGCRSGDRWGHRDQRGVASTVRDAHMRDFETYVVSDGCAAFTTEKHDTALADMANVATVSTIEALCGVSL